MDETITLGKVEYYQEKHIEKLRSFMHGFLMGELTILLMLIMHNIFIR